MNAFWWVLLALSALWFLGRVLAWRRGMPVEAEDLHPWWESPLARLVAFSRRSTGNWAVTIGRVVHVRRDFLLPHQVAHELRHAQQAHRLSVPAFLSVWAWQWVRHGYRAAPLELDAEAFEAAHAAEFKEMRKQEET